MDALSLVSGRVGQHCAQARAHTPGLRLTIIRGIVLPVNEPAQPAQIAEDASAEDRDILNGPLDVPEIVAREPD